MAWMLLPGDFAEMYASRFYSKDVTARASGVLHGRPGGYLGVLHGRGRHASLGVGFNSSRGLHRQLVSREVNPHSALLIAWMSEELGDAWECCSRYVGGAPSQSVWRSREGEGRRASSTILVR